MERHEIDAYLLENTDKKVKDIVAHLKISKHSIYFIKKELGISNKSTKNIKNEVIAFIKDNPDCTDEDVVNNTNCKIGYVRKIRFDINTEKHNENFFNVNNFDNWLIY